MHQPEIVLDTNVLVAGLRSRRGSAFRLLSLVGGATFGINVSVPLLFEYEDVLLRPGMVPVTPDAVRQVLDYHCLVARHHDIFFLWRPQLRDPRDDMLLELAVTARCDYIVTFNLRDFVGCERFGVEAILPGDLLRRIGDIA